MATSRSRDATVPPGSRPGGTAPLLGLAARGLRAYCRPLLAAMPAARVAAVMGMCAGGRLRASGTRPGCRRRRRRWRRTASARAASAPRRRRRPAAPGRRELMSWPNVGAVAVEVGLGLLDLGVVLRGLAERVVDEEADVLAPRARGTAPRRPGTRRRRPSTARPSWRRARPRRPSAAASRGRRPRRRPRRWRCRPGRRAPAAARSGRSAARRPGSRRRPRGPCCVAMPPASVAAVIGMWLGGLLQQRVLVGRARPRRRRWRRRASARAAAAPRPRRRPAARARPS